MSEGLLDYYSQVGFDEIPNATLIQKFGTSEDIGNSMEVISTAHTYQMPLGLTSLEIVSDNVNDTFLGTGGRTVTIDGIGPNYEFLRQTVPMNGTTAVAFPTQMYRVFEAVVSTSGTYPEMVTTSSHQGTISVQGAGGGQLWASIEIDDEGVGKGQSQTAAYTVPLGFTANIANVFAQVSLNKTVNFYFFVRFNIDQVTAPFAPLIYPLNFREKQSSTFFAPKGVFGVLPEKTDFGVAAVKTTGAGITDASMLIQIIQRKLY